MSTITTHDGVEIYYKDWGPRNGQPIVFHHGWPLTGDDWDAQMLYFVDQGYRVVAHDRRGHGRSAQVSDGHDMDHYAADVAALVAHLDLRKAIHIGHSTGGGEATRYVARYGETRDVAKLALIGAVPPVLVKSAANPGGTPIEIFDGLRQALATHRAQFYWDFASGPFYGYNRPGEKASTGVIQNWWRQGMMGGAKAHYDCIKAFSETDFTEDLKTIAVPAAVMGDDPIAFLKKVEELVIPLVGSQWPTVMKEQRLRIARAPVLVENVYAIPGGDEVHGGSSFRLRLLCRIDS
jgi:non-heme chloroperoxidase